jgi:hypothetical protein
MAKTKLPAEFPSDWHFEQHLADIEHELAGRINRKAELEAMGAQEHVLAEVDSEIAAARAELKRYGKGQASKATARRPRKAAETSEKRGEKAK